jgi:hypothetical protein
MLMTSAEEQVLGPISPQTSGPPVARLPKRKSRPANLALGVVVLAAERLPAGAPTDRALAVGIGLLQQTVTEARLAAERVTRPPARLASRGARWLSGAPDSAAHGGPLARSRDRMEQIAANARQRGAATMDTARADAVMSLRTGVDNGIAWTVAHVFPKIVDDMMPQVVDHVMPQIIEGAMPQIRTRVLPVVIDDLSHDPRVRDLMVEQGRGAAGEAAQQVRATTASADDRVEAAYRRMRRGPSQAAEPGSESATGDARTEPPTAPPGTTARSQPNDG